MTNKHLFFYYRKAGVSAEHVSTRGIRKTMTSLTREKNSSTDMRKKTAALACHSVTAADRYYDLQDKRATIGQTAVDLRKMRREEVSPERPEHESVTFPSSKRLCLDEVPTNPPSSGKNDD